LLQLPPWHDDDDDDIDVDDNKVTGFPVLVEAPSLEDVRGSGGKTPRILNIGH
jgi:hypothetical protein